jgi:MOSC domain-containing protein YiiM
MRLVSVNVGMPRDVVIDERIVSTGIYKTPVAGKVRVGSLNLEGDGQADPTVHGGRDKAVYIYPSEHYEFWRRELKDDLLGWGIFGENLTSEGLSEDDVRVGDHLAIDDVLFEVTQPRLPCFKLAAKLSRPDIIKRFLDSRRTGFYVRVLHEGAIQSGGPIAMTSRDRNGVTVRELVELYTAKNPERTKVQRVVAVQALSSAWREHFESVLSL